MEKLKINSISGGKTSCFMALNFKADYNVFAINILNGKIAREQYVTKIG